MKLMTMLALLCLVIVLIVLVPFFFIWSLNTLFPVLAIKYSLGTWVASAFIMSIFGSQVAARSK